MAVAPNPLLKAHPDVAKLNSFSTPFTVTITRHLVPRGGEGMSVVPTQPMTREALFNWQGVKLLTDFGPGYYHFHVVDPGGNGEDEWKVKLGTEAAAQEGQMPGPFGSPVSTPMPGPTLPLDADVKQIMPGFWYNEALGLLHTRWGTTVPWKQGEPWPSAPLSSSATTSTAPGATWAYPGWDGARGGWSPVPGWGNFPATGDDSKVEALKQQLEQQRQQLEASERRRDEEKRDRQIEEQRAETRRYQEETNKRFEMMFEKLTSKPSGPSETELRLAREMEETKRRAEAIEAESRRREEMRLAEDRHREEMRATREEIKALGANKTDPIMTLVGQMLSQASTSGAETARMIRETSATATAAAERSSVQILELARGQRDGVVEASKATVESMKDLMGTQKEFYGQMLDLAGSGNQSPWVNLASQALERIGSVGQALAERNAAAQQPQAQYVPPPQQRQQQQQPRAQTVPGIPIAPPTNATGRPGFIDTGGRPAGTEYDTANDEFVLMGGHRVKGATVQLHGWKFALDELGRRMAAMPAAAVSVPVVVEATPMNGASHAAPPPPVRGKKGKTKPARRGRQAAAPAATSTMPPPADPKGYSAAELTKASPEDIFEIVKQFSDPEFFGDIWSYVERMRANPPTPEQTVAYVLQGRSHVRGLGKNPPAMQLVDSAQYEVLVFRLFPEQQQDYRAAVVERLRAQLDEGGGDEGGEEEGDDDDEEGDEGEAPQQ